MGDSEFGEIPEYFQVKKLSDIADVIGGGTPSKKVKEYFEDGNISWITPKDLSINKNIFIDRGKTSITRLGLDKSSAKLLPKNSILFSSRAPIGYTAISKNELATNQGFKSLIALDGIPYQFIFHLVKRAVLEQNGQLTIVEYGDESIRYPIIVDGQANMDVLELIKKDEHWLLTQIQEQGFQRLQEIYLGEYLSGQLSLSPYEEKTIS
ncbi:YetF domain-containing protein [Enterococcus faecalis]|nr:restriction endonuclease subunit S [Enterococcus faecalis]